jgi:hypothetical protein
MTVFFRPATSSTSPDHRRNRGICKCLQASSRQRSPLDSAMGLSKAGGLERERRRRCPSQGRVPRSLQQAMLR